MKFFFKFLQCLSVLGIFVSIFADPDMSDIRVTVLSLLISILVFLICEFFIVYIIDADKIDT